MGETSACGHGINCGGTFFIVGAFPVFRWVVSVLKPGEENDTVNKVDELTGRHFEKSIEKSTDTSQKTKSTKSITAKDQKYINELKQTDVEKAVIEAVVNLCNQDKVSVVSEGFAQYYRDYLEDRDHHEMVERVFGAAYNRVMEALEREPQNIRKYLVPQSGSMDIIGLQNSERALKKLLCHLFPWIQDGALKFQENKLEEMPILNSTLTFLHKTKEQKLSSIGGLLKKDLEQAVIDELESLCQGGKVMIVREGLSQYYRDYLEDRAHHEMVEKLFGAVYNRVMEALEREPENIRKYLVQQSGNMDIIVDLKDSENALKKFLRYIVSHQ